ncbi:MAG: polar amino acid transport system substrate-binding protein, partial [Mycobacterium sp.]|nr:polar amino acid transport system substrate-binding protein [Mycobacterium sp.]
MKTTLIAGLAGVALFGLVGCSSSPDEAAPSPTGPAKVQPPAILDAGTLT